MSWITDGLIKLAQYNPPVYMARVAARKAAQEVIYKEEAKASDCGHAKAMLYQLGVGGWRKFHDATNYPNFNATNCVEAKAAYRAYLDWLEEEKLPQVYGSPLAITAPLQEAIGGGNASEFVDATTGTGTTIKPSLPPIKIPGMPDIPGLPNFGMWKWIIIAAVILVVIMIFLVILGKSGLGPAVGSHMMKK